MTKNMVFAALIFASGYFNYWQGFYRGEDIILCIVATAQDDKDIINRRCPGINNIYFHWRD